MASDALPTRAAHPDARAAGARLAELFDEHGKMVYGVCWLLMRDPDEAEDAAQQTFLSAYRSMLAGHEPREPAAWLGTIARNECRARIRKRMSEPLFLPEEPAVAATDVEYLAGQRGEVRALCEALAELPHQQRDAIVLREFYGLSYDEAAAALGVSRAALESLIFRGRRRLQDRIRPARLAQGALVVPLTLRDSLAHAAPGFGGSTAAGSGAVTAALSKLAAAPLAAKVAAATVALTAAGTSLAVATRDGVAAAPARTAAPSSEPVEAPSLVGERGSLAVARIRVDAATGDRARNRRRSVPALAPPVAVAGDRKKAGENDGASDSEDREQDDAGQAEHEDETHKADDKPEKAEDKAKTSNPHAGDRDVGDARDDE